MTTRLALFAAFAIVAGCVLTGIGHRAAAAIIDAAAATVVTLVD